MRIFGWVFLLFLSVSCLPAQVTFTEHIAPIIYNKCSSCHHAGGIGPISLSNYTEVVHNSGIVAYLTALKAMPPWMPDTSFSHFLDERVLTEKEIKLIQDWVATGMQLGNKAAEPELPLFSKESQLGKPDLTVSMSQSYIHMGDNKDEYRVFPLPTHLAEGHDLAAIEIVPGNPAIAHHIILGLDTTNFADKLDAKCEGYGYEQYSGFGFYPTYYNWSGWVPGNKTRFFPAGIGSYILPKSQILLQMHYGPSPIPAKDSTVINIYYSKQPVKRYLRSQLVSPIDIQDGPFFIPANTVKTFHAKYKIVDDFSIVSITPHAHWLGKKWEVFAINAHGDTTKLIKIDDWDFNWQNFFTFTKLIKLEKGSYLYSSGTFDNTSSNSANPNFPPKNVTWGESAKDEMFLLYFATVPYVKDDENIETGNGINYLKLNDTVGKTTIEFNLAENSVVNLTITDALGKKAKELVKKEARAAGKYETEFDAKGLKPGNYYCKLATTYFTASKKLQVK